MGNTKKIEPKININNDTEAWIEGEKIDEKPKQYGNYEPVTYSLDKNAAKYIRVTRDGTIIPLQVTKSSGVNVTIKTLSSKTGKVKVVVNHKGEAATN